MEIRREYGKVNNTGYKNEVGEKQTYRGSSRRMDLSIPISDHTE